MKNILKYKYALAMSALLVLSSCDDLDQDYPAADKPVATMSTASSFTIMEGESATITLEITSPISAPSDFKIDLVSGNGSLTDVDIAGAHIDNYETGPEGFQVTVPAYATSVTFDLDGIVDIMPEPTETLNFRITGGQAANAVVSGGSIDFDVTLQNFASESLAVILDWEGDATYNFENGDIVGGVAQTEEITESLCAVVDFDLIAYPGGYIVGSADCPEMTLDGGVLPDGTYDMVVDLYSVTTEETPLAPFGIPYTLTLGKTGTFVTQVAYPDVYSSDSPVSAPPGAGPGQTLAATVVIANGLWTVYDADGALVAQEGA